MKKSLKFTDYIEWADYGFERKSVLGPVGGTQKVKGDFPFKQVKTEEIIRELTDFGPLGIYSPRSRPDIVEWGQDVGAIKVEFSPIGSTKAFVRRKIKDLKGENTWICKKVFPVSEHEVAEKEIPFAHDIHEHLEKLSMELIDSPKRYFPEFKRLSDKLTHNVRMEYPSYCMFPVGMKTINEDYYKIFFEFRGQGVNRLGRDSRAEQFDIDLFWDSKKGLIRCWGYDIESTMKQHTWQVTPSQFDEWFAPSQPIEEIVECVSKIFMTY